MIVCVVDGRGSYKKSVKFCPTLEQKSNIECVVGIDRLDCVRRIHKGSAHFGVFSAEDLVTARWASVEILVTNEMRFHDTNFEYEVVAVVDNEANINSAHDLKGSKLCHPGNGLEGHWSDVLGNVSCLFKIQMVFQKFGLLCISVLGKCYGSENLR